MMRPALLACAVLSLAACRAQVEEGRFSCNLDDECPSGWFCEGHRCFSTRDVDASARDDAPTGSVGSDAATPCGARGLACCAAPSAACGDQLFCDLASGLCFACGGLGQSCCPAEPSGTCREGDCVDDTCIHCGGLDEPCCSGTSCTVGSCCERLGSCTTACP